MLWVYFPKGAGCPACRGNDRPASHAKPPHAMYSADTTTTHQMRGCTGRGLSSMAYIGSHGLSS